MIPAKFICTLALFVFLISPVSAQSKFDSIFHKFDPQKWSAAIEKKASRLQEKIIAKSEKTLSKLQKQEEKIYTKLLATKDSLTARAQLEEINSRYVALKQRLKNPPQTITASNTSEYIPYLDTLQTTFKFLNQNGMTGNIPGAMEKLQTFSGRLQQANEIKNFIKERRTQLQQQLQNLGMAKDLKKINKEVFYYAEQIREYKEIFKDPKKIERKALELLSKTSLFKNFMQKNSMLASLFRMPGDDFSPTGGAGGGSLAGLQTRAYVNNLIQQQLAAGGSDAMQQFQENLQSAQSQLNQLKEKFLKVSPTRGGLVGADDILPEGFKPNEQKTKSFWKRLELGTNIQSQKAQTVFPVTSDIGLSLGYKLNDKSIIGLGTSYKMGWGSGWNNIRITHQGIGLRSFIDWKLKGSFWVSGGFEQNYKAALNGVVIPSPFGGSRMGAAWQQSGLIGLSKVVSFSSPKRGKPEGGLFKKTKLQLLWDFLSYRQVPRAQPIVFRVGYNIK